MNWRDNYRAVFRNLSEDECFRWEKWLHAKITNMSHEELDAAVDRLCSHWEVKERGMPLVRHVQGAIMSARKVKYGAEIDDRERVLMKRMHGETPAERWETICEPNSWKGINDWGRDDACRRLEVYGEKLPGGVKRPDFGALIAEAGKIGKDDER